jgi:predicted phosphodiesterase
MSKLVFRGDGELSGRLYPPPLITCVAGTFVILHISDTHYELHPDTACSDLTEEQAQWECGKANTTTFIDYLIKTEQPDLVVHTGNHEALSNLKAHK